MKSTPAHALEVRQTWRDLVLETRHHAERRPPIRATTAVAWRWSVLGVAMGPARGALRWLLPAAPPLLSEVDLDRDDAWLVPDEALPDRDALDLFTWAGDHYVATVPAAWQPALTGAAEAPPAPGPDGLVAIPLREGVTLRFDAAGVSFEVRRVDAPRGLVERPGEVDLPFLGALGSLGFAAAVFGALAWSAPPPTETIVFEEVDRFVELALQLPPEPEPPVEAAPATPAPKEPEAAPAPEPEGRRGKRDGDRDEARAGRERRRADRDVVQGAGIFAVDGGDGLWAAAGLPSDLADSVGLAGSGPKGVARGTGLGRRGAFLGGGGREEGLGGLDPRGTGASPFAGPGCEDCGVKVEGGLTVTGPGPVIGNIDPSVIQEVVTRHLSQIRYCYQRELQRDEDLGGRVVVKFSIATDGTVSSAATKESTLDNPAVESCVNGRFLRMTFPPLPHGIAIVSYPFLFSPGS